MTEEHFKNDAKSIVDLAFDTKIFKDTVTRDDMNRFQNLIEFMMQSKFEMYVKSKDLLDKLENRKK